MLVLFSAWRNRRRIAGVHRFNARIGLETDEISDCNAWHSRCIFHSLLPEVDLILACVDDVKLGSQSNE